MYYTSEDVFISYCSKNQKVAEQIKAVLEAPPRSVTCWMANDVTIASGDDFRARIVEAIRRCKVFLFILSKDSMESHWCSLELSFAILENKQIYSIRIDDAPITPLCFFKLGCAQISDATVNFDAAVESVSINVKKCKDTILEAEKKRISQNKQYRIGGYACSYFFKKLLGLTLLTTLIIIIVAVNKYDGLSNLLSASTDEIPNYSLILWSFCIFSLSLVPYFIFAALFTHEQRKILDGTRMDIPSAHYAMYLLLRIGLFNRIVYKKKAQEFLERSAALSYQPAIDTLKKIKQK